MDELQFRALDLLLDDHFALWDFSDSIPAFRPDSPDSRINDLIELVRGGLVGVTFGEWFDNETAPVDYGSAVTALRDPASWEPTGKKPGYALELTEMGVARLRESGIGLPDR